MRITGSFLIFIVLILYFLWIWFTKKQQGMSARDEGGVQVFDILVKGVYSPSVIRAKSGKKVKINFRREESNDCSRFVNFPDFKIRKELPEGKTVVIEFTPERFGEYIFTCDMSMYRGKLIVE